MSGSNLTTIGLEHHPKTAEIAANHNNAIIL